MKKAPCGREARSEEKLPLAEKPDRNARMSKTFGNTPRKNRRHNRQLDGTLAESFRHRGVFPFRHCTPARRRCKHENAFHHQLQTSPRFHSSMACLRLIASVHIDSTRPCQFQSSISHQLPQTIHQLPNQPLQNIHQSIYPRSSREELRRLQD